MTPTLTPHTIARIEDSFRAQGLMRHLGVEMAAIRPAEVTLRLPFHPDLTQQMGYFHAGATTALADSAGGYAALTLFPEGCDVLTTEFKLNLLNPAEGDCLEATGRVVKAGRTLTVCQVDVHAVSGVARAHVATGLQTLICVQGRAPT
ncbi:PaaI family thioesterase [Paracoccus sp. Ld10]|uniref:PaaI family thioesterase n=1 Tax=Paracoccus sp. Ld10 TaxID=649158 RepID=UPI003870078B